MHKLDPNDMDALFRDGADKHEFNYNPEAWAMMEEKLDKKNRRKYFSWLFLGAILIAGLVGIYLSTSSVEQTDPIATISSIDVVGKNVTNSNLVNNEAKIGANEESKKIDISELIVDQNTKQLKNSSDISKIDNENKSESNEQYINTISKVRSSDIVAQNRFYSENTGSLVNNEVVSVSSLAVNMATDNIASKSDEENIVKNGVSSITKEVNKEIKSKDFIILETLNNTTIRSISSLQQNKHKIKLIAHEDFVPKISSSSFRYAFTAFGSSDFSTVGFFKDPQAGFSVGGKIGIQMARMFQFDIGFAYSLKKYGSAGKEYNIAGGWDTMVGVDPTWMDGKGNILQIPIEATYYFNGYENNSFFVNAGISSFLFNSEWYGFKYDETDLLQNPNATPIPEITMDDINRRNFHPAGIARLSIGYQRIISPNMAFELSPYLQIPLTGLGEGKVDLYTAGMQFAIKFSTK